MTFREVVEAKDLDALETILAEDVVLHSPVSALRDEMGTRLGAPPA